MPMLYADQFDVTNRQPPQALFWGQIDGHQQVTVLLCADQWCQHVNCTRLHHARLQTPLKGKHDSGDSFPH